MVITSFQDLGKRIATIFLRDTGDFVRALNRHKNPDPGLYTYQLHGKNSKRRLHLRVEGDGAGTLFVDVSDVIRLNESGTYIAKNALDGVPIQAFRKVFRDQDDWSRAHSEIGSIYNLVAELRDTESTCPTCTVSEIQQTRLFGLRAYAPYKADLALTYGCNNKCSHCYNEPDRFSMRSLTSNEWKQVIFKLFKIGVPHIIFTGGEATLHPDLPDLVRYADELGLVTGLNTNGRRFASADYVHELFSAGLNHVQITLGSSRPGVHDSIMGAVSFKQTLRGIRNAVGTGLHTITNTTLMHCNSNHVDEIIDFLYAEGIRTFAMNGMIYAGGGFKDPNAIPEKELQSLLISVRDQARERDMRFLWYTPTEYCRMSPVELDLGAKRCNAGEYSICIEPNGDVLPCQSFYVSAGNILTDPWQSIWRSDLFLSFRHREEDPSAAGLPEKCWVCPDLELCGGGCRIEYEARNGRRTAEASPAGCTGCSPVGALYRPEAQGFIAGPSAIRGGNRSRGKPNQLSVPLDSIHLHVPMNSRTRLSANGSDDLKIT